MSTEAYFFCGFVRDLAVILFPVDDDVRFCCASQDRQRTHIHLAHLAVDLPQANRQWTDGKKNKHIQHLEL